MVPFYYTREVFPILMVQMFFSQIQQGPGPNFRKVRNSLYIFLLTAHLPVAAYAILW